MSCEALQILFKEDVYKEVSILEKNEKKRFLLLNEVKT